MKKLCFILLMLALESSSMAQKYKGGKFYSQLGLGWNISSINPAGFNYVLNRFAETRLISDAKFEEVSNLNGPSAALTFYGNLEKTKTQTKILIDIGYTGRIRKLVAEDNLLGIKENIRLDMHTVSLGFGTVPVLTKNFDIGIGAGFVGGLVSTFNSKGDQKLEKVKNDFIYGVSVFAPIYIGTGEQSFISFGIRPYFQYFFNELDFSSLNQAINPLTANLDEPSTQKSKMSNFGIEAQLVIILDKNLFQ